MPLQAGVRPGAPSLVNFRQSNPNLANLTDEEIISRYFTNGPFANFANRATNTLFSAGTANLAPRGGGQLTTTQQPPNNRPTFNFPPITFNTGGNNSATGGQQGGGGGNQNNGPDWNKLLTALLAFTSGSLENRSQKSSSTSTSTPVYGPEENGFKNNLISGWTDFMNKDPDLTGYTANQISDTNRLYGMQQQNRQGELAARGITGPAASAALTNLDDQRFAKNVQTRNEQPLLARQLKTDALSKAGSFFGTLKPGTSAFTSSETSGNILGGGLNSLLAYLLGLQE